MHSGRLLAISALAISSLVSIPARDAVGSQSPAARQSTPKARAAVKPAAPAASSDARRRSVFARVEGSALSADSTGLSEAPLRLRDARFGRIVRSLLTDANGFFAFQGVDPGSYVVELLNAQQQPVAASQLVSVNAADIATVVVREPAGAAELARELDLSQSYVGPVSSAAALGLLAVEKPKHDVSPR